jgi:glycosyltransferase involved in cell wall biosynthesis
MSLSNVQSAFPGDEYDDYGGTTGKLLRRFARPIPRLDDAPAHESNVALELLPTGVRGAPDVDLEILGMEDTWASDAAAVTDAPDAERAGVPSATPRISVIVPTYNEAKNLPHVLAGIPADIHEVIVVDGHSVDDTVEVARTLRRDVRIVLQNRKGKGNAMACGFAAATGDILVMLDADGSADPGEISQFVGALTDGADFAKGTRFRTGGGSADITAVRAWGNRWLNRLANLLFGTPYTDLCYGYNAFWRRCLDQLELDPRPSVCGGRLWGDGFEIETIINTRVAKAGLRITEVPSYEYERLHGLSNLNTWRDGGRVVRALLVERFNGKGVRRVHRFADNVAVELTGPGALADHEAGGPADAVVEEAS